MAGGRFKYRLFRASDGVQTFWRWEVYTLAQPSPLESGVLYGTNLEARLAAERSIFRLSHRQKPDRPNG